MSCINCVDHPSYHIHPLFLDRGYWLCRFCGSANPGPKDVPLRFLDVNEELPDASSWRLLCDQPRPDLTRQ